MRQKLIMFRFQSAALLSERCADLLREAVPRQCRVCQTGPPDDERTEPKRAKNQQRPFYPQQQTHGAPPSHVRPAACIAVKMAGITAVPSDCCRTRPNRGDQ